MRALLLPYVIAFASLLGACVQEPSGPPVCTQPGACSDGRTCVVGRCRGPGGVPASSDTRRLVLLPDAVAVLSSSGKTASGEALPETFVLGRAASGSLSLLLHFGAPIVESGEVVSAFLVLDPVAFAPSSGSPVELQIARILEPWRPETVSWGRQPHLDLPERAGAVIPSLRAPARIDVTHIVRAWAKRRPEEQGIAVFGGENDPFGATFSLGVTEGQGPRIEVYVH